MGLALVVEQNMEEKFIPPEVQLILDEFPSITRGNRFQIAPKERY